MRPGVVQVFVARDPEATLAALVEQAILGARAAGIRFEHNLAVALPFTPAETLPGIDERDEGETSEAPPGAGFQLPVVVDVTVFPDNPRLAGPEKTNLEAAVKAALIAYVEGSAIGGVLVYNRIVADLLAIAGVLDVILLVTPKAGSGDKGKRNMLVPPGRRATLAEADVTVRFAGAPVQFDFLAKVVLKAPAAMADAQAEIKDRLVKLSRSSPGDRRIGADGGACGQRSLLARRIRLVVDRRVRGGRARHPRRWRHVGVHCARRYGPRAAARRQGAGEGRMSVVATRVSVPAYPLFVRDAAQAFVLAEVESALGRLDGRSEGVPPTRDATALLGRVLAAHVLRAVSPSSERARLRTLLGLRPEDDALAESLDAAWMTTTQSQALKDELELIGEAYGDYLRSLKLAAAGTSGHGRQMLSRFPAFMRADRRGKALGEVAHALGRDLDEADRQLLEIRDAHAIAAAKEEGDVLKLACALGFQRADFLVLAKLKDKGFYATDDVAGADAHDRAETAYRQYLTDLKQAVGRFARICLRGCGTVPALLEGAMVLLNGDPRGSRRQRSARGPGAGSGVSRPHHRPSRCQAAARRLHPRPAHHLQRDRGDGGRPRPRRERGSFVYLIENPIVDQTSGNKERRGRDRFRVKRGGFFAGPVAARITGTGTRTVHPRIVNLCTHRGFGFDGVVPDGLELVFATDGRAFLDGAEITDRCHLYKGALFGESPFDAPPSPHVFPVSVPEHSLERNFPRPARTASAELPTLRLELVKPIGSSTSRRERSTHPPSMAACLASRRRGGAERAPPSAKVRASVARARAVHGAPAHSLGPQDAGNEAARRREPAHAGSRGARALPRRGNPPHGRLDRRQVGARRERDTRPRGRSGAGRDFRRHDPGPRADRMTFKENIDADCAPLIEAKPGDPITAEGWNNIRTAVLALFDVLNKSFGTLTVVVKAKGAGTIVDFATVTAVPANGGERPFRIAQFAGASVQLYQIQNLLPGKYHLVVEAPASRRRRVRSSWTTPAAPSSSASR